jgi:hypothetical protein
MSGVVARNARIYKGGVAIALGKGFTTQNSAEVIKDYSNDSRDPALLELGNNTHKATIDKLYADGSWLTLLLAGTKFTAVVAPKGSTPLVAPYETWSNCVVTNVGKDYKGGGVAEKVEIEAMSVTPTDV